MALTTRPWDTFFNERMSLMIDKSSRILDIGAGLRLSKEYSNRVDSSHQWIADRMKKKGVEYVVLDYVDAYHPHIVGDIQDLPLPDNSEESAVCLAILEHVENPSKSFAELYRVLKPGGMCLLYVPFLYYYHAEGGYYRDYWRFTRDAVEALTKPFSQVEIQNVRGAFEAWIRLSPLGRSRFLCASAYLVDRATGKLSSKQTGGYCVWLVK